MHCHSIIFWLIILLIINLNAADGACQSCLVDMTVSGLLGAKKNTSDDDGKNYVMARNIQSSALPLGLLKHRGASIYSAPAKTISSNASSSRSSIGVLTFITLRKLLSVAYTNRAASCHHDNIMTVKQRWAGGFFIEENSEANDETTVGDRTDEVADAEDSSRTMKDENDIMSGSMILALKFYKGWISPLLPPACRFLPTCSQYGVQAIEEFGPSQGLILTAWRLARCTPLGGRGYVSHCIYSFLVFLY